MTETTTADYRRSWGKEPRGRAVRYQDTRRHRQTVVGGVGGLSGDVEPGRDRPPTRPDRGFHQIREMDPIRDITSRLKGT